jgi:hypothetical protein
MQCRGAAYLRSVFELNSIEGIHGGQDTSLIDLKTPAGTGTTGKPPSDAAVAGCSTTLSPSSTALVG